MSSTNTGNENLSAAPHPVGRWSIARRLAGLYTGATALLLVLVAAYLYWTQVNNLAREDNDFLINKIQDCRRLLREHAHATFELANEVRTEAITSPIKYYVRLLDDRGRILLRTPGMNARLPATAFPPAVATTQVPRRGMLLRIPSGQVCLLMAARVTANTAANHIAVLQVALDVSAEESLIVGYRWKLLTVVLLGTLLSGVVGVFVARRGLKPLERITHITERVTANQLHERIGGGNWPVELASLARSFDRMLNRLEDSFLRLSQFSGDLAHELRTPINNLRGEAGVALSQSRTPEEYRRTLESSLEEYARLTRLIDNLLFLARTDDPVAVGKRAPCDARKAAETVCEYYAALAEDRNVQVRCFGQGTIYADPVLLRQAISNLLSNALNHTPAGGRVTVEVQVCRDSGVQVVVADNGGGIAPAHLPHIFDRLYRADPARSRHPEGAGLGLAIVQSIMARHGGTVTVESTIGQGSRFTLIFPKSLQAT